SRTAQRPSSSLRPRLLPGTPPGFDNLSHWLRPLDQTVGSKRRLGVFPARGFPKDVWS
ncbi:hypothetical protein QL093DRAFT_2512916, partial [Fusarium oxysporum]